MLWKKLLKMMSFLFYTYLTYTSNQFTKCLHICYLICVVLEVLGGIFHVIAQVIYIIRFLLEMSSLITPQIEKLHGMRFCDLAGNTIGCKQPIHFLKLSDEIALTGSLKCASDVHSFAWFDNTTIRSRSISGGSWKRDR